MSSDHDTHRRPVLKALGAASAIPLLGSPAAASEDDEGKDDDSKDEARPPIIHSHFGYSGTSDDDVPERLRPDETVELHVDDSKIEPPTPSNADLTVEFGAFHFEPVGLALDPGDIVKFDFHTPEHSVTAYHPDQERQQRVPDGVPAFSSTVNEHHGFWLYRFEEEGVYDMFCGPHEWGGMGMRIVVGDNPGAVVRGPGRPPLPLTGALLGSGLPPSNPDIGHPKLAPDNIVAEGPISIGEDPGSDDDDILDIDLEVTVTGPS